MITGADHRGLRRALRDEVLDALERAQVGKPGVSGAMPTLVGLAVGIPLALVAGRVVREQLYGIGPWDLPTILAVAAFMTLVTILAAVAPAVKATRIDPVVVLRHDAAG